MQAIGKVDSKVMNELDNIFYKCLWESVGDLRQDVISSEVLPKLTGELESSLVPVPLDGDEEIRLSIMADYADELYYLDETSIHTTEEEHMEHDLCVEKYIKAGLNKPLANPNAQPRWFDTYIDGDKKNFVKETYENHLKKELNK